MGEILYLKSYMAKKEIDGSPLLSKYLDRNAPEKNIEELREFMLSYYDDRHEGMCLLSGDVTNTPFVKDSETYFYRTIGSCSNMTYSMSIETFGKADGHYLFLSVGLNPDIFGIRIEGARPVICGIKTCKRRFRTRDEAEGLWDRLVKRYGRLFEEEMSPIFLPFCSVPKDGRLNAYRSPDWVNDFSVYKELGYRIVHSEEIR